MSNPLIGVFIYALGDSNALGTVQYQPLKIQDAKAAAKRVAGALSDSRINEQQPKMTVNTKSGFDLFVYYQRLQDGGIIIVSAGENIKQTKIIQNWNYEIVKDLSVRMNNVVTPFLNPNSLDRLLEKSTKAIKLQFSQLQQLDEQLNDVKKNIQTNIVAIQHNMDDGALLEGDTRELVTTTSRFEERSRKLKNQVRCKKIMICGIVIGVIVVVIIVVVSIVIAKLK